ncbi:hypothetical protein LEP1GSC188_3327 [Leptospira weilii serovar Topaz str. LT2116]|uniref:Uncharacterized protein n=1 Tax=Leptospira weilii serovar Topaz str. LT2116 TaxID=1088540 RepID=M3G831_9LEPT|nr:hypothetical protein LEP1GSC188_3327 [Leptospira weilii serovar Topaz str. LT2116]
MEAIEFYSRDLDVNPTSLNNRGLAKSKSVTKQERFPITTGHE